MNLNDASVTQGTFSPINMGLFFSVPISSATGSPGLIYRQTLIAGHILSSAGVLIGAELFLIIAQYLFKLESIPILDLPNQQILQMPVQDFQDLLKTITGNTTGSSFSPRPSINPTGERGFITPLPPEAPLVISIFVTSDFSNKFYTPSVWIVVPIIALPGLRGILPILILSLLATIFVRTVVAPETSGAKPMPKQSEQSNSSPKFSPEELLRFLSRFGKYFSSH
jgi:hypothetical protein